MSAPIPDQQLPEQSSNTTAEPISPVSSSDKKTSAGSIEPIPDPQLSDNPNSSNTSTEPTMEIHTHGHVHQDKKWKEYLFQFLMLFLAVMAGFFTENLREHYVERHRAKELSGSLIEDLKADTSEVRISSTRLISIAGSADIVMKELDKPRAQQNDSLLQLSIYRLVGYDFFDPQSGTYQQMKSSGSLRYLGTELSLLLTKYETGTGYLAKLTSDAMAYRIDVLMPYTFELLNGKFIESYINKTSYSAKYFLQEPTEQQFNGMYIRASRIKSNYNFYVGRYEEHRQRAIELIEKLRESYPGAE
ncbi:MAG: hypothetical protein ABI480_11690 [Chitinophagaceae bacterium]